MQKKAKLSQFNIQKALNEIPFYKSFYGDLIHKIQAVDDLNLLPELDKSLVNKNFPKIWMTDELEKAIKDNDYELMTTSGSTSKRLQLIRNKGWLDREEEIIENFLKEFLPHISNIEHKAILTTAICSNTVCYTKMPSYEERTLATSLHLNNSLTPNSWTKEDIKRITQEIDLYKPTRFHADPIYLAIFFKYIEKYKLPMPKWTPAILTFCYEYPQKKCLKIIKSKWDIPTYSLYGATEVGYIHYQCNHSNLIFNDYLSHINYKPLAKEKDLYIPLVSCFRNKYMPFINYNTGDVVKIINNKNRKCSCSKTPQVSQIMGRIKDIIYTKDNIPVTIGEFDNLLGELNNNLFIYCLDITFDNQIIFKYTTINEKSLSIDEEKEIQNLINQLYGNNFIIKFSHEKDILPGPSGKFEMVKKRE